MASCHRRAGPIKRDPNVSNTAGSASVAAPRALGEVESIGASASWGACARTTTGQVWCFGAGAWRGRVISALHDADAIVGAAGSFGPDDDNRCRYYGVCARSAKGLVTCATNVRSADLVEVCGRPRGSDGGPASPAACALPLDDLRVESVRAIDIAQTGEYRNAFCDAGGGRAGRVGILLALETHALVIPTYRAPGTSCCRALESQLGDDCISKDSLSGCSAPLASAPVLWMDGLARMADGTVRRLPLGAADEITAFRDAVRIAHAEALACAIDSKGVVRCMNEPFDGICPNGPRPKYRDWHEVKSLEGATDVAIATGPEPVVCALRGGAPWCWGLDGLATTGTKAAPPRHLFGTSATEQCVVAYEEGPMPHHCTRKPMRVHDITDAVQLVALGEDGFCVRRAAGKISCWGVATKGALQDVTPP